MEVVYWRDADVFEPINRGAKSILAATSTTSATGASRARQVGTPQALMQPTGQIDWQIELDPWGNTLKEYNPLDLYQPIRMQGQQLDEDSGLFYNRYRYYDPKLGRYISRDPIGLLGGMNSYLYSGNPNYWFDPMGLQKVSSARGRSGLRQPALFDSKVPQGELDRQTMGFVQMPDYGAGNLVAGKKPWQSAAQQFSPYDYTQYCKQWSKPNLTCTASDRVPGRDVKVPSDYIPNDIAWATYEIPQGYSCDAPYYFLDIQGANSAASADIVDLVDVGGRILKNRRGFRK